MPHSRRLHGYSLPELLIVVVVLSALLMIALPAVARARDVFSIRAARETILAAATRTRSLALNHGGAHLQIDAPSGALSLSTGDSTIVADWSLRDLHGVTLTIEHSPRNTAVITYDRLGVGRLANLTLRISRGSAAGGVTFSAYGRPRAW
ncbi:MAG: prepilin-type N-terminal cleavage/methylation domain-containing protein [Gemmatimonadota bacterium]